jgi:pimeloyl-ACP methyl ester carboxylesterase
MTKTLFLPGAGGSAGFWLPVANRLDLASHKHFFSWPGLGNEPHDLKVCGIDDLVAMVVSELDEPADLIAQSMGGVVAVRVALRAADMVQRLVLTATSGGVPVADLGGFDWRADYRKNYPNASSWITEIYEDLSAELPSISASTLLLWGEHDLISPPAVGRRLHALLPQSTLHIIRGGDHDLAQTHAAEVAQLIAAHLRRQ